MGDLNGLFGGHVVLLLVMFSVYTKQKEETREVTEVFYNYIYHIFRLTVLLRTSGYEPALTGRVSDFISWSLGGFLETRR